MNEERPQELEMPSKGPFIAALIGNILISISKFVAGVISGSSAMLAEGVHSLVDSINNVLMLYGIRSSTKKPTPAHPFGYGKELYFWSLVVAMVFFGMGGGVSIYEGILKILEPEPLKNVLWSYIVLAISFIADGITLVIAYREFKPFIGKRGLLSAIHVSKDPTKFTVVLEDGAATSGVVIAAIGVALTQYTGVPYFDSGASIVIGLMLCLVAIGMAREAKGLLLGESAAPQVVNDLKEIICADPGVLNVERLLSMHMGPYELLLNLDLQFKEDLDTGEISKTIERIEKKIKDKEPQVKQIFIEAKAMRSS